MNLNTFRRCYDAAKPLAARCVATLIVAGLCYSAIAVAQDVVFKDGFEPEVLPPPGPVVGTLQLTSQSYASPAPTGTQIQSLSQLVESSTDYRYLQSDTSTLVRVTPTPVGYQHFVHFDRMHYAAGGDIEAPLTPVDLSLNTPENSTSGCEAADFNGFPVGHIALLQRGACDFSQKAANADRAGAVAVIIFNQGNTPDRSGRFYGTMSSTNVSYNGLLPVISTTFALGQEWASSPGDIFRLRLDAGMRSNAWELVPVMMKEGGSFGLYWIRNSETGQLLYAGDTIDYQGVQVRTVSFGDPDRDDQNGWWEFVDVNEFEARQSGAVRILNVGGGWLTAVYRGRNNVDLLMADYNSELCVGDVGCNQWYLDNQPKLPEPGSARVRSALGDVYLHMDNGELRADSIKPQWPGARWIFEHVPNTAYRRLLNAQTGEYLHTEFGTLQAGAIEPGWTSAMWLEEEVSQIVETNTPYSDTPIALASPQSPVFEYVTLRNVWTGELLVVNGTEVGAQGGEADKLNAIWYIEDTNLLAGGPIDTRVREVLGITTGRLIRSSEAAGLYSLSVTNAGLTNVYGIEHYINLRELDLSGNFLWQNLEPLSALTNLEFLNLSHNPLTNIDFLLDNPGLGGDDKVLLLRSNLSLKPRDSVDALYAKGVVVVPTPGKFAMHDSASNRIAWDGDGMIDPILTTNAGNWMVEYDPGSPATYGEDRYWIYNEGEGYMGYEEQNGSLEFTGEGRPNDAEWVFEFVDGQVGSSDRHSIRNVDLSGGGDQQYLLACSGKIDITADNCPRGIFYIERQVLNAEKQRANAAYYDPKFAKPPAGLTRIQHRQSRQFLYANSGQLNLGRVDEGSTQAQWQLIPVQYNTDYLYAVRNASTNEYMARGQDGTSVGVEPLPIGSGVPDAPEWAAVVENRRFLFDLDGIQTTLILPYQFDQQGVGLRGSFVDSEETLPELAFSALSRRGIVWNMDGGIPIPPAPIATPPGEPGFVEVRDAGLYITEWNIEYRVPGEVEGNYITVVRNNDQIEDRNGIVFMPENAYRIRVKATCIGCNPLEAETKAFTKRYDRPPNKCIQAAGTFANPHASNCEISEGSIIVFAMSAAEQSSCEIRTLIDYIPQLLEEPALQSMSEYLINGQFEKATSTLFNQGVMAPDFTDCGAPYEAMSFGAGAEGGLLWFEGGGEIGIVWGLSEDTLGALSYSGYGYGVGEAAGLPTRVVSLGAVANFGFWKTVPRNLPGKAIGLSLGASMDVAVDFEKLNKLKEVGVSVGVTLWFACDTGADVGGILINVPGECTFRDDATFSGFTLDFSVGVDKSLPLPETELPSISGGATLMTTCVPADDCD
jgi:hypothetical protein